MDRNETVADIVAKWMPHFQKYADPNNESAGFDMAGDAVSALEEVLAAAKRETVTGNAAKMREALESTEKLLEHFAKPGTMLADAFAIHMRDNRAALAAPPRNCDVPYPDTVAMYDAFKKWCNNKGHAMEPKLATDAFDWMLATATPTEGGDHADA